MQNGKEKVILFFPAYFAEKTLASVYGKIPKGFVDEVILVDDASKDEIGSVARSLGIKFYKNSQNLGYGGNIKVCLEKALEHGGDIIIELHPDDQYDPSAIGPALEKIKAGYDFVMGSRFISHGNALYNKMPLWKFIINRLSNLLISGVLGVRLSEYHCGFRVYHRRFLEKVDFQRNDNDYLFSFQIIMQAIIAGVRIGEVPVVCRYFPGATQISVRKTIIYGQGVLMSLWWFLLARIGIRHQIFKPKYAVKAAN